MDRVCKLNSLSDALTLGLNDHHDQAEKTVRQLIQNMHDGSLREYYTEHPSLDERLILRNMSAYPDFSDNEGNELNERFSCVDPKPLIFKYNKQMVKEGRPVIQPEEHDKVNKLYDVVAEILPSLTINRIKADEYLKKSVLAFFPDDTYSPDFSVSENLEYIVDQIDSLNNEMVIERIFHDVHRPSRYVDFSTERIADLVSMAIKTYFARFEYNAAVDKEIVEKAPLMAEKLYDTAYAELDSAQRIVTQLFVAHDWVRDARNDWLADPKRIGHYPDDPLRIRDYLDAGEQGILFEIIPSSIHTSEDLQSFFGPKKPFFGGKTIRLIARDEALKERCYVQFDDLPMSESLNSTTQYNKYAAAAGEQIDKYSRVRPHMIVLPAT